MMHITAHHMSAFLDELQKEGGLADYGKRALEFGRDQLAGRYGRQLAVGAGLGAVGGAVTGDEENWKGRALKGALLGGGLAGGRILATKAGREAAHQGLSRFGEKQLYHLTGKGYGGKNIDVAKAHELGILKRPKFEELSDTPGLFERTKARLLGGKAQSPFMQAAKEHAANVAAHEKGFMNVPGVIHGALTQPGELLRSGWNRAGTVGKAFALGGVGSAGLGMLKTPEEGGPGRLERGLRGAGSALGYMVAPGAMIPASIISSMGAKAGGTVGKIGDVPGKVVAMRRAAQQMQADGGQGWR